MLNHQDCKDSKCCTGLQMHNKFAFEYCKSHQISRCRAQGEAAEIHRLSCRCKMLVSEEYIHNSLWACFGFFHFFGVAQPPSFFWKNFPWNQIDSVIKRHPEKQTQRIFLENELIFVQFIPYRPELLPSHTQRR